MRQNVILSIYDDGLLSGVIISVPDKLIQNCTILLIVVLTLAFGCVEIVSADEEKTRNDILRRIQMTQSYLDSKTATRILESGTEEARQLLEKAKTLLESGKQDLEKGNLEAAEQQVSLSIRTFTAAGSANTTNADSRKKLADEVRSIQSEIDSYLESFKAALSEKGPSMAGLLDQQYVETLLSTARQSESTGDFRAAHSSLNQAKKLIVDALIKIRNNETVVYAVEFQTPADEFRYEHNRYLEYVALGQQVVSNGEVAQSRQLMFNQLNSKGEEISQDALSLADRGDYEDAIKRMEEAVKKMVQGLRMLGIQLSM